MKATTFIKCIEPNAHDDQFNLTFGNIHIEGGALVQGNNLRITADDMQLDDGGHIKADAGGFTAGQGRGAGVSHRDGGTGASHGGTGGRGQCKSYLVCRTNRAEAYGDMYLPKEYGSGGGGSYGGYGMMLTLVYVHPSILNLIVNNFIVLIHLN